jgi:hypothetical protein
MFGPLCAIINEDRVAANRNGFDTHSHRNIFNVVAGDGELELCVSFFSVPFIHRLTSFCKDPMDNTEILRRGDLQLISVLTNSETIISPLTLPSMAKVICLRPSQTKFDDLDFDVQSHVLEPPLINVVGVGLHQTLSPSTSDHY